MPHIDGLRAVAIILVIVFHTRLNILPAGFIGVDIFFVISGFLITNQLLRQLDENRFSLRTFYLHRFRRLIPAYIVVSIASLIVAAFLFLPEDFEYHSKIVALAFISLSNFYLANTTLGYFDPNSDEIPFLHTWSLAVEEQYYLLWPIVLFLLYTRLGRDKSIKLFLLLFILSIGLSEWMVNTMPEKAYYLLPSRFYELLSGGILACALPRLPTLSKTIATLLSTIAGTVLISISLQGFNVLEFPGIKGIAVSLASVIIIYCGFYINAVSNLLSTPILTGIGKISYSLYLWHWPIFAFITYYYGTLSLNHIIPAVIVSFLLSFLTWKYIETPYRKTRRYPFGVTLKYMYILPAIGFIVCMLVIKSNDGFSNRFGSQQLAVETINQRATLFKETCSDPSCKAVLLIGDSHAQQYGNFIHTFTQQSAHVALQTNTMPGCLPLKNTSYAVVPEKNSIPKIMHECFQRNESFFSNLRHNQYRYIVLAGYWSAHVIHKNERFFFYPNDTKFSETHSQQVIETAFIETIQSILEKDITPVIIEDIPTLTAPEYKCTIRRLIASDSKPCLISASRNKKQQASMTEFFDQLKLRFPDVLFISPNKILCDSTYCKTELDSVPLYYDEDHLNRLGSQKLGEHYLTRFSSFLDY
jgi:peptidoglycan/LPS O-acetylase OafA/YrhL